MIDSHAHLDRVDLTIYEGSFDAMLSANLASGIEHLLCVSIDLEHYPSMLQQVLEYPQVSVSVGVHPCELESREPSIEELVELASHTKNVAIGETGLDNHYENTNSERQEVRFRTHIRAAHASGKPLIIHTRDARERTIKIMREERANEAGGVMHCFTENWKMAKAALDLGFYISFSGILTFKNATALREVAARVPLERLLIETDSPYLAPVPHRGKPNEPRYVCFVAEQIAAIHGLETQTVIEITRQNFYRLFPVNALNPDS